MQYLPWTFRAKISRSVFSDERLVSNTKNEKEIWIIAFKKLEKGH